MDLLITNGKILTMNNDMQIIENGYMLVKNGKIENIGSADTSETRDFFVDSTNVKQVINAKGGIIMPGLINTHTHASMTLFRGLADDLPLIKWLHEHIFSAESGLTVALEKLRLGMHMSRLFCLYSLNKSEQKSLEV